MPGPVPKRSAERRRRNKENRPEAVSFDGPPVEPLEPSDLWHPIARQWFDSLAQSGQSTYYEPSDWAVAFYVAEAMSRNLAQGQRFSAQLFGSVMSAMTELLTTEGARRRMRMEVERTGSAPLAPVDDLSAYRDLANG